jgi:geranylgeranyl reductase family protein
VNSCDALILGGGPAGSTLARQLVRAGLDVIVMDKQAFPRDKICAGWITPAVIESLDLDCADYAKGRVLQPVRGFRTGVIGGAEAKVRYRDTASYGIRRCEFDHYLLERSKARLAQGESLKTMVREDGAWLVNGRIKAPLVVGAGGHFCPVARVLGSELGQAETIVAAQEIELPLSERQRGEIGFDNEVAQLYFCADLKGYGWCFPKGDYLNVGLGREDSHKLSEHVQAFCSWLRARGSIPRDLPAKLHGHAYLLYPSSRRSLTGEGALLIGDAAGLAYPQSGEGIRPAVESALMAAEVILEAGGDYRQSRLEPYASRVMARFGKRNEGAPRTSWLPEKLRQKLAAKLLATKWFARHVVIDRWFLHSGQPVMPERRR